MRAQAQPKKQDRDEFLTDVKTHPNTRNLTHAKKGAGNYCGDLTGPCYIILTAVCVCEYMCDGVWVIASLSTNVKAPVLKRV